MARHLPSVSRALGSFSSTAGATPKEVVNTQSKIEHSACAGGAEKVFSILYGLVSSSDVVQLNNKFGLEVFILLLGITITSCYNGLTVVYLFVLRFFCKCVLLKSKPRDPHMLGQALSLSCVCPFILHV